MPNAVAQLLLWRSFLSLASEDYRNNHIRSIE